MFIWPVGNQSIHDVFVQLVAESTFFCKLQESHVVGVDSFTCLWPALVETIPLIGLRLTRCPPLQQLVFQNCVHIIVRQNRPWTGGTLFLVFSSTCNVLATVDFERFRFIGRSDYVHVVELCFDALQVVKSVFRLSQDLRWRVKRLNLNLPSDYCLCAAWR